ncbi:MAG: hypothetical protein E7357_04335 [Clostridiales bacterium]|nr:hypothetical protein [Clostridiales bacterium]
MKRTTRNVQLRKRIKSVQNRAKFVGILYLLGLLGIVALTAVMPLMDGAATTLTAMAFFKPFKTVFAGGMAGLKNLPVADTFAAFCALLYGLMLLAMLIDVLRSFSKLGWLFKRRASYSNGFNRNMYAMDDIAKRFSGSFALIVITNLLIYMFSGDGVKITTFGYITLAVGLFIHFVAGLLGGKVTLFTTGDRVEEEEREHGLLVYFVRNVLQLGVVGVIVYFLLSQSVLVATIAKILDAVMVSKAGFGSLEMKELIPAAVELVAWLCVFVLVKHATGATEYNRECMHGAGMKNFAVFAFFATLAIGALVALPYLGIGADSGLNSKLLIAAIAAFVGFLLDCIVQSRRRGTYDELDMDAYFREGEESAKYNNTII